MFIWGSLLSVYVIFKIAVNLPLYESVNYLVDCLFGQRKTKIGRKRPPLCKSLQQTFSTALQEGRRLQGVLLTERCPFLVVYHSTPATLYPTPLIAEVVAEGLEGSELCQALFEQKRQTLAFSFLRLKLELNITWVNGSLFLTQRERFIGRITRKAN